MLAARFSRFLTDIRAAGVHLPFPPLALDPQTSNVLQTIQDPRLAQYLAGTGGPQTLCNTGQLNTGLDSISLRLSFTTYTSGDSDSTSLVGLLGALNKVT